MAQQYDAEFKARAVELVARKTQPASAIAKALGVPRKTLYRWVAETRQHPEEPFRSRHSRAGGARPGVPPGQRASPPAGRSHSRA
jgi:transposase-like protein